MVGASMSTEAIMILIGFVSPIITLLGTTLGP